MTKKKLTPAQKFHRRLAAMRVRDRFFQHDKRSSSREGPLGKVSQSTSKELQSAVVERPGKPFPTKKTRKMKRSNYWRQIKLRKKQKQEKGSTGSCCCHCACSEMRAAALPGTTLQLPANQKLSNNNKISTKLLVKQLSNLHQNVKHHQHYINTMQSTCTSSVLRYFLTFIDI